MRWKDSDCTDSQAQPVEPVSLGDGETSIVTFEVLAAAACTRRYWIEGAEKITWDLQVFDGYDIVFSSRVACMGLQSLSAGSTGLASAERSREITERERSNEFSGHVDLAKDHADVLNELGAANRQGGGGRCLLILEFDNIYSYFTAKTIELKVTKSRCPSTLGSCDKQSTSVAGGSWTAEAYRDAIAACRGGGQWERACRLLRTMKDGRMPLDATTYHSVMDVCGAVGKWQVALSLLDNMRSVGLSPTACSYSICISACENAGEAREALRLMDKMEEGSSEEARIASGTASEGSKPGGDIGFIRQVLHDAIERCPEDASALRGHLMAASASLEDYVRCRRPSG